MNIGRLLVFLGLLLIAIGFVVILAGRSNFPFGRLPGDLVFRGRNTTFYFPWVTCILISVLLTLIMWFIKGRR